jgi:glycerol uptake facilitator protein
MVGTMLLILIGNGSIANANLKESKGYKGGFLNCAFGYSFGLMLGIFSCQKITGAHLNPAITIASYSFNLG